MEKKVPFNNTARVFTANQKLLSEKIIDVAKSGWWLLGTNTSEFSQAFAKFCGTRYCLPVANGSDALELALRAVFSQCASDEKSEVVTVANAGGYATIACRLVGAIPVYTDIEANNQLMCPESLAQCLGPKVKAVIVTHLYGGVVDVTKIRTVLDNNGHTHTPIIEDCAQAHGAMLLDQRVGSLGDLSTFSFYPTKNLGAMGDAGAILTSDEKMYQQIQSLHQYGWKKKYQVVTANGRNSRMDEMQAAILNCLLPQVDEFNSRRKSIYEQYREAAGTKLKFLVHEEGDYVAHLAVIFTPERHAFINFMEDKGIAVDIHYPILDCDQPAWRAMPMRLEEHSHLKIAREAVDQIVSLPCFPMLKESEIERVCQSLRQWESV